MLVTRHGEPLCFGTCRLAERKGEHPRYMSPWRPFVLGPGPVGPPLAVALGPSSSKGKAGSLRVILFCHVCILWPL